MTELPKGPFDVVDDLFRTYRGWTESPRIL